MSGAEDKADRFLRHLEPLQGALETYCRRNLNDPNAVEDVLQSAVSNAYRDFQLYVENTNFRAWIFRYLNLEILGWNRRKQPTPSSPDVDESPVSMSWEAIGSDSVWAEIQQQPEIALEYCSDELSRAVQNLPEMEKTALLLRAIGEFKYREIAEILEIPVGSVMGYLDRARTRLRHRLLDHCRREGFFRTP